MEKGKLYINKTKKVIVLCSGFEKGYGLFKGVVVYTNGEHYSVGDFLPSWISENFDHFNGKLTDLERKDKLERILKINNSKL